MDVQVGDLVGNIKTVLKHCIALGIGASVLLFSYLLYAEPAFANYQQKACSVINYISGNVFRVFLFLIASYLAWIIAKVVSDPIPWPFKSSLVGVTIGDGLIALRFLGKEENGLIREELENIEYGNSIIRKIGAGAFAFLLVSVVAFIISGKAHLLIPIGCSCVLIAICALLHHKMFRYQANFMLSIKKMATEERDEDLRRQKDASV